MRIAVGLPTTTPTLEARLKASKGRGKPLLKETRSFMEPRFGQDFSGVQVHTGSDAVQMNRELGAQAFTHGQDIYLGAGKYAPKSSQGKRLLAHELTHVVQQTRPPELKPPTLSPKRTPQAMIPGDTERFIPRSFTFTPHSMIQGDKIDYRQLTWEDFKKKRIPKRLRQSNMDGNRI